jgi:hypothetical protein
MARGDFDILRFLVAFDTDPDNFTAVTVDVQNTAFEINEAFLRQANQNQDIPEGARSILLRTEDTLGNISPLLEIPFLLDRTAPTAPEFNLAVESDTGAVGDLETAEAIVSLVGMTEPNAFVRLESTGETTTADGNGDFRFDNVQLIEGANLVEITVIDIDGNTDADSIDGVTFSVVVIVDFRVNSFLPLTGALEVGTTFRPQVFFTSPVNPDSLNDTNFFASFGGEKLDARIVPANDGSFAWLFFEESMPDAAMIQITVDGSTILAMENSSPLDADGDGNPGGMLEFAFSTVSLASVPNTTLRGQVVDPGPDRLPMTADDFDPGPDGIPDTDDDIHLLPIAGVEVFILGREDQVVVSDANGRFELTNVPAGNVKVAVNGLTVTDLPPDIFFPEMVMNANMLAGTVNFVMPGMETFYLPRVPVAVLQDVDASETTMIDRNPAEQFGRSRWHDDGIRSSWNQYRASRTG